MAALLASQGQPNGGDRREAASRRLADAKTRLARHMQALEAGVDPKALVDVINTAHAERVAAEGELTNLPVSAAITDAEIYAVIDSLGDVGEALNDAKPEPQPTLRALGIGSSLLPSRERRGSHVFSACG